jgi:hypothetical protein
MQLTKFQIFLRTIPNFNGTVMKENIKHLVCFDFDGTLIHTPLPEDGKKKWEEFYNMSFPRPGWWGSKESLDLKVFYPSVNDYVFKFYKECFGKEDTYTFLATGRLVKLETEVKKVLDLHNIKFDDIFCNNSGETLRFKKKLFEKKIEEFKNCESFTMFDDRYEHIQEFIEWSKQFKSVKVTVVGWGLTDSEGKTTSPFLKKLSAPLLPISLCSQDEFPRAHGYTLGSETLCIQTYQHQQASCPGDSGGPLFLKRYNQYTQVGVVSWGSACSGSRSKGSSAVGYAAVSHAFPWIQKMLQSGK